MLSFQLSGFFSFWCTWQPWGCGEGHSNGKTFFFEKGLTSVALVDLELTL